jgi:hypothetical protein
LRLGDLGESHPTNNLLAGDLVSHASSSRSNSSAPSRDPPPRILETIRVSLSSSLSRSLAPDPDEDDPLVSCRQKEETISPNFFPRPSLILVLEVLDILPDERVDLEE